MAAGILYIGRDYRTLQELWISNEDGRQHIAVPGTTGAGKTAALVSLCANALGWGSGFIFVDGKADNRLYADVLALARRFGREDDVLVLNFLVASGGKHSHTFNPFAWGNADVIRELLVSQIESNPSGDKGGNHVFMQRAVALMGALTSRAGVDARHPRRADRHREHPLRDRAGEHRQLSPRTRCSGAGTPRAA